MKYYQNRIQLLWVIILVGSDCLLPVSVPAAVTYYRIGNSLTWQSSPAGIKSLFTERGYTGTTSGYHVNCGSSLINTWNNPTSTCAGIPSSPSVFTNALPNYTWWAITAQPFPGGGSTLGTDVHVITNFVALLRQRPANATTPTFIFATHPYTSNITYQAIWTNSVPDTGDAQATVATRQYYDRLYARLAPFLPTNNLSVIPAGEILFELDVRMKAGRIPGYTDAYQLYSDSIHLNNEGDYIEGCATFSALTGQDPWGLTAPGNYGTVNLTTAQYNAIHDAIWHVIRRDPNARPIWYSGNWPYKINRIAHFHDAIVRTNGTLVEAVNLGSAANVTVNGVTFTGALTRDGLVASYSNAAVYSDGGVSANFETLLDSFAYFQAASNPGVTNLVLTGLTPGLRYEMQLFVADQRNSITRSRMVQFAIQGKSVWYVQEGLGYSVTGAFIATGTTERVTINATIGTSDTFQGAPMLNAFQVRQAADPVEDPDPGAPSPLVWIGTPTGSNDFTTATRWSPNSNPANGDTLVFGTAGNGGTGISDNTASAVAWNAVQFTGNANDATSYNIAVKSWSVNDPGTFITVDASVSSNTTLNANRSGVGNIISLPPGASTILNNGTGLLSIGSSQPVAQGALLRPSSSTAAGTATLVVDGTGETLLGGVSVATASMALVNNSAAILSLTKNGTGTLTINSAGNTFTGGATITAGTVILDNTGSYNATMANGVLGSGVITIQSNGQVRVAGAFNIGKNQNITLAGGALTSSNGVNYLHNLNITNGGTVNGSSFALGFAQNSTITLTGAAPAFISSNLLMVKNTGTLATFNIAADLTISGNISDNPSYTGLTVLKTGPGTLLLTGTNTYIGDTIISNGTFRLTGSVASPVTVRSGATITGTGTINNNLLLTPTATLAVALPGPTLTVNGNLTLDGTLNITDTGGFAPGTYTLISYSGTLTNNGLAIGATPNSNLGYMIDTNTAGQVRLVVLTQLESWQMTHFGFTNGIAVATADPEGDGQANLIEYALGLDPNVADANPIHFDQTTIDTNTYLRLSVIRDPNVTDVLIEGLSASNLVDWSAATTVIESNTPSFFRVRDAFPIETNSQRFLKLRFSLP